MRKEPVDQLTVRAAPLDPVTITDQPHTLPHQPSPGTPDLSVNPPAPRCGTSAVRACRRAEGRLTGIFFSVIQKKVVTPNDFPSLEQLSAALLGFVDRYNRPARPVQLGIHRQRPARPHGPHQPPRAARRPSERIAARDRMTTPNELTGLPT